MRYFCPSAIFDYLGDKMGENLQISKLKIKNLQKWMKFLMLEIKRIMSYICRWYAFLCKKSLSHAELPEYFLERFFCCYPLFAGDVGEMVDDHAEVFGKEVAAETDVHGVDDTLQTFVGTEEG